MKKLLLLKEQIVKIYTKNEVIIMPLVKFIIALVVIEVINVQLGYMAMLNEFLVIIMAALMCSFLPMSFITLVAAGFALGHFYAIGIEVAGFGVAGFLILYLLLIRFVTKEKLIVAVLPVLIILKIPYFIPVLLGLIGTPFSVISACCGIIAYYIGLNISNNVQIIASLDSEAVIQKVKILIDALIQDKAMLVMMVAFSVTIIVVYTIRRLAIDNCWTIAAGVGYAVNIVILMIGDLAYDTNISIVLVIVMSIISFAITRIVEFFIFNVDFSRIEKTQFEDDDYYYYVRAIPKINLSETKKKVRKINTRK